MIAIIAQVRSVFSCCGRTLTPWPQPTDNHKTCKVCGTRYEGCGGNPCSGDWEEGTCSKHS